MSKNTEAGYVVETIENAIEAVHAIGSADRTKAQVAGALIGWLASSKTVVVDFQSAYIADAMAKGDWPYTPCLGKDEGAVELTTPHKVGKVSFMHGIPFGMNKAYEKVNRTNAVSDWMSTRQYLAPLELTDTGMLKLKGGKPKLDAAKKSASGGAAQALASQGVVELVVPRDNVGKKKGSLATTGGTEAVLKALHTQLKSVKLLCDFEEDADTWGDVIEELAATLEIKI